MFMRLFSPLFLLFFLTQACATVEKKHVQVIPEQQPAVSNVLKQNVQERVLKRKVAIARFSNETKYGQGFFHDENQDRDMRVVSRDNLCRKAERLRVGQPFRVSPFTTARAARGPGSLRSYSLRARSFAWEGIGTVSGAGNAWGLGACVLTGNFSCSP